MHPNAPASAVERFAAIVEPHYELLYRAAYRLTRSTHDAEDLAQEVCVRAYPRLAELESLDQPRAWLLRVMYRLFVDWTRRYERTHVESMEIADLSAHESDERGPAELAELMLDGRYLEAAWEKLDREQRGLLAMHDVEGYTLAELREITGLKEGTLKSRLHRARVRLGKLLQREQDDSAARKRVGAQG